MESPSASDVSSAKKRLRKANFTDAEVKALLQQLALEVDVALSPVYDGPTNKMKAKAWERIATRVNACSGGMRTPEEVRSKWKCLKKMVAKQVEDQIKTGVMPKPLPYQDVIISLSVRNKHLDINWGEPSSVSLVSDPQSSDNGIDCSALAAGHASYTVKIEPSSSDSTSPSPDIPSASSVAGVDGSGEKSQESLNENSGNKKRGLPSVLSSLSGKRLKTVSQMTRPGRAARGKLWMNVGFLGNADAQERALFSRYLQSEIVKNRAKKVLIENMNRKVLLEIEKLERELGDTNDQDLG